MGLFGRISTVFKANVNHMISKAEDPEKMLNQITEEMQEQLVTVKQQVTSAIADEKRLQKQHQKEAEAAQEWERKATLALGKGNEDLAREALVRRKEHDNLATEYQAQWEKQKQAVEALKDNLRTLERKIEEAKRKKQLLIARQKRAQAQKQIHETMAGLKDSSAFDSFARMEAKVEDTEARADAVEEMAESEVDTLDDQFAALEDTSDVDDELAALKAKLSKPGEA